MNVWLGTLGFVYTCYNCGGKDDDGYVLRDSRFSVVWEKARIGVAEGIIVGVSIVGGEGRVVWV